MLGGESGFDALTRSFPGADHGKRGDRSEQDQKSRDRPGRTSAPAHYGRGDKRRQPTPNRGANLKTERYAGISHLRSEQFGHEAGVKGEHDTLAEAYPDHDCQENQGWIACFEEPEKRECEQDCCRQPFAARFPISPSGSAPWSPRLCPRRSRRGDRRTWSNFSTRNPQIHIAVLG